MQTQSNQRTPGKVILKAQDIKMHFPLHKGLIFQKEIGVVKAVDGVTIELREGETLGLVGESGCGKSTLGRCLVRLYKPTAGSVSVCEKDITTIEGEQLRKARLDFQMIFQDPFSSLNPRMTVFDILAEPLTTHKLVNSRAELAERVSALMRDVGLSPRFVRKYPHEFSGGQRQRIAVARALALNPKVIVCDEPVSALDVSIQAQILNLLEELQHRLNLSYIFIAHDISVVRHISHRIAVMYLGRIVEIANAEDLFDNPRHPYTRALLSAVPVPDPKIEASRERIILTGDLPSPINPPNGCTFHTRCPIAIDACKQARPEFVEVAKGHRAACIRTEEAIKMRI